MKRTILVAVQAVEVTILVAFAIVALIEAPVAKLRAVVGGGFLVSAVIAIV